MHPDGGHEEVGFGVKILALGGPWMVDLLLDLTEGSD